MPDLTTTVPGVAFVPPPDAHIGPILAAINRAVADLSPGSKGALVSVVNAHGANAAIVAKLGKEWVVQAFIGKAWSGPIEYGAAVKKEW
jgi:hypothetical protein